VPVVYALSVASQMLLALPPPAGFWIFVAAQAVLAWSWFALHAKRLRDAAEKIGLAAGIAVIYALAVLLLVLVTAFVQGPMGGSAGAGGDLFMFWFALAFVLGLFVEAANLDAIGIILFALALAVLLPFVLAVAFSIWAATRPRVALTP
jgi:hypothetical protein